MPLKLIKLFALIFLISCGSVAHACLNDHLDSIRNNPNALYRFFKKMPKGGELHYHFTGSAYPEDLIKIALKNNYCLNPSNLTISPLKNECHDVFLNNFIKNKNNHEKIIRAWSMKNLKANYKDRHDHFFNVFGKTNPIYDDYYATLLSGMILRAAKQHELYMEIMLANLNNSKKYAKLIANTESFAEKIHILINNKKFKKEIQKEIKKIHTYLEAARDKLGCAKSPDLPACKIEIRFQAYVMREAPINEVFAQTLFAFLAANNSNNIVGVNLVQPENGATAMKDFNKQMAIFNFLHQKYPLVNIALHAGELDRKTNKLSDLCCHINESIHTGQANRIGHGTDIRYEKKNKQTLKYMAENNIAVEINLASNKLILSIKGREHPITDYLNNNVPIVLSTDDEGILRTNLTKQYVYAAKNYNLSYSIIKNINRNALTYSFIPGKSIWLDPKKEIIVPDCVNLNAKKCIIFISQNKKAKLQWILENQLTKFEQQFKHS